MADVRRAFHHSFDEFHHTYMYELTSILHKRVRVITTDGRLFEGVLQGCDKQSNVVISSCVERVIDEDDEDNQELDLGIYFLRGGMVVCVGEIDDDEKIDWLKIKGATLKDTKNPL